MNKKKFKRVLSLYQDGVSFQICCMNILEMSSSKTQSLRWLNELHLKVIEAIVEKSEEYRLKAEKLEQELKEKKGIL